MFGLYKDLIQVGLNDKLTVSTWLTVLETCRHSKEGLADLLKYSKQRFSEVFDKTMFDTESEKEGLESGSDPQRRMNRAKKPKSVLLSK